MEIEQSVTNRGFDYLQFLDRYGNECSIQKSSLATENAVWFGINNANPQIMSSQARYYGVETEETTGWVPYPIPDEVSLHTRMHLTQEQVKELLPALKHFAKHGELP